MTREQRAQNILDRADKIIEKLRKHYASTDTLKYLALVMALLEELSPKNEETY